MEYTEYIESVKINYDSTMRISREYFTAAACEILGEPIEFVDVCRCTMGKDAGKLTVFVFKNKDDRRYWESDSLKMEFCGLPTNISQFKEELGYRASDNYLNQ